MLKNNISEKESIVLSVIQEYLDENRPFDNDKIIPYIKYRCSRSSININKEGIKVILTSLINNYYIVQGSKLSRSIVLKNTNRRRLFEVIKNNPGIYLAKLIKKTKFANHVVCWHVNVLLKFNCIKKDFIENHEVYYLSYLNFDEVKKNYYLAKKKTQQILALLKINKNRGFTKTRLSKLLKTHYTVISKYIDDLEKIGILRKVEFANSNLYYLTQFIQYPIEK